MGNVIWIDVYGQPDFDEHNDMYTMLRLDKKLDILSQKLGVTEITKFYDYRALYAVFDEPEEDWPDPVWFDADIGLKTFKLLYESLRADWGNLDVEQDELRPNLQDSLIGELAYCLSVLKDAMLKKLQFRLMIVP